MKRSCSCAAPAGRARFRAIRASPFARPAAVRSRRPCCWPRIEPWPHSAITARPVARVPAALSHHAAGRLGVQRARRRLSSDERHADSRWPDGEAYRARDGARALDHLSGRGATQLQRTFTGVALAEFAARGEKRENCTHLHDLAILAAAHAFDGEPLVYDILVSDPIDGRRRAELRRNGAAVLAWSDEKNCIVEPAELAGVTLDKLRPWIESLPAEQREVARLLQWGAIIANGRSRSVGQQSDASELWASAAATHFRRTASPLPNASATFEISVREQHRC